MSNASGPHAEHYAVREELVDQLRRDLMGPGSPDEILTQDPPITAYPIGVLFPRPSDRAAERALDEDGAETEGLDDVPLVRGRGDIEESTPDLGTSGAGDRRPSSMGITFAVDPSAASSIVVHTEAARYDPIDPEGRATSAKRAEARSTSDQNEHWRRRALDLAPLTVDVTVPKLHRMPLGEGAGVEVFVRPPAAGTITITVTLVNTETVGERELQDAYCLYQPRLTVTTPSGAPAFVERPAGRRADDPEVATSRLLHRHAPTFAMGHGCAAEWDWTPPAVGEPNHERAAITAVRTQFLPAHEVLLTDSNPDIDDSALTMHGLATRPESEVLTALNKLMSDYAEWIDRMEVEAEAFRRTSYETPARERVEQCRAALARMRRGIRVLGENTDAMRAFRLANRAMAHQRARGEWVRKGREGAPDETRGRWRPFQISFMLLCLEGIVDPRHDDRSVADLLWFPTGGGKTEAYLGLIAFTTFLRRLRLKERGAGVTVLMRYTLRLLTLQQFERAAALICAMERIRLGDEGTLGAEPISIGMWVGQSATPNRLSDAEKSLVELRKEKDLQERNPVQLHACPWCGTRLDAYQYEVDEEAGRMHVRCPDEWCDFRDGLPVHLVDEAVYDARPTLVIATVDKFAAMPWRVQTAALFNRDRADGTPPPELIVQDELHLISGPLGTLTGLYETAVDLLSDSPKVIASTATIRRASDQGKMLFDRAVAQFPPAGIDARDSWFAVETPKERKASRQYVGLLTPSTSQATLLVRTYANLLHRAALADVDDEVRDAYWTLVGYFNSLRLLAAAELQVHDDVDAYLGYLASRENGPRRKVLEQTELTSRANSSDIPKRLKQLERRLPHPDTVDVLLATNMISVGVDVDRLGLMAVMGQPQTTAEYIQATSRVGRRHPGLVAVMLNSARSRDRSHYESFQHFHSALYREVESTSVTPFSSRARDRGLHAVVVALARILIPAAAPNDGAGRIREFRAELENVVRTALLARVKSVAPDELPATAAAFDEFVDWWEGEAEAHGGLLYEPKRGNRTPSLLSAFDNEDEDAWPTLWSLRDVDAESALFMEASR
ncbi:helicase-like protein [Streptomyces sp. KhCrAH-43]|uniref:helicase-related protein n=1 Tax=unclassified Streptomyces TaxID=2593676 RepID=UPI0003752D55|nr:MULTISPECIES: helicase-related protein [unclassified Streptomyces]MYS34586.1 DNA helicase [Streptomyces sp. SID4920]MYX65637.1 DNA helicase [Streptomyces sp. SID8373]RAJ64387.1 helicase-like protein [Streptomyces sp. KhCrAH-43]